MTSVRCWRSCWASALSGIVPVEHIYRTEFGHGPASGEVSTISRVVAGYGKVAVIEGLSRRHAIPSDRIICVGDGSSKEEERGKGMLGEFSLQGNQ